MSAINRVIVVNDDSRYLTHRVIEVLEGYDDVQEAAEQAQQAAQDASQAAGEASQAAQDASQAANDAVAAVAVASRAYPSRAALVSALPTISEGSTTLADGQPYVIDSTAVGMASAMWDIGVDGVRAPERPLNAYVAAFHDHNSPRVIRLYSSIDGKSWRLLNSLPLEYDGGGVINGGNPVLCYRDGWFWLLVSFTSVGNYDFRIYKTRDFSNWLGPFNCNLGPTPVSSNVNPAPGASVPCNEVWGVDMTFTPAGELHVRAALPFAADIPDVRGRTIGNRRVYRTVCTDLEALTFSAPVLEDIPSGHPSRLYQSTSGPLLAPTFPLNHQNSPGAGYAGFEIGFAERFCAAFPLDDLIIVPCGKGASGFSDSEWTAGGAAYTAAVGRIQAVIAAHPDAVIEGVLWHQGEADRNFATYQTELSSLVDRFRADIPALAGKPFILGEIGQFVTPGTTDINAAVAAVAAAKINSSYVASAGLTDRGDSLHFNAPSYRRLGTRYWDAFATLRGSVGSGGSPVKRIIVIAGQSNSVGWSPYVAPSMIDASVTRTPGDWLLNVKDSSQQTIRVYNGPSIIGPWAFQEEVENTSYAIEGSSIVPRRLASGNVAWDLYCEGHNTIPDWISAQRMMVYRGGTTPAGWGSVAPTYLRSTRGIRHGTPLNLGFEDPAAAAVFERFAATAAGDGIETNEQWNELLSGNRTIVPNPGAVYYVTGSTVTNLTILDGAADEFYLAVLSTNVDAGIVVQAAGMSPVEVAIGFGQSNHRLVRFRKRDSTGQYYAEAGAARAAFSANKSGSAQTVPAATETQITFSNEVLDAGGHFSANGWTPPAGRYLIQASVTFSGATADQTNVLLLKRAGSSIRRAFSRTTSGNNTLMISGVVTANGTDTFTLHAEFPGSGDKTVSGSIDVTWFEGVSV